MIKKGGFAETVWLVCASLLLFVSLADSGARGAQMSPTEKALLDRVEALEGRMGELEQIADKDANDLTIAQRVEKLETAAAHTPQASPYDLRAFWNNGLRLESADEKFKLKIGGRTAVDVAWFNEDSELEQNVGNQQDGIQFRRAYLYMAGLINGWIEFKSEYEFAGDQVGFEDVYIGFTKIPYLGKIRFGHIDEPFGLELRTSNRHTTFMERALTHAIIPGTETGVLAKNLVANDRVFFNVGVFRDTDQGADSGDGAYNVTGRLVGLPVYADEGRQVVHLGVSGSHRNPDGVVRYSSRPEANLSNFRYVDTGDILADDENLFGLEFAWINGPFSVQAEYVHDCIDTQAGGDVNISAYYAFVSYFLTGESRFYDLGSATFDRPKVKKNFREGGPGAWEVAIRFSSIDLDDGAVRGGTQDDITVGLNWYFNPNVKLMFNYVRAMVDRDLYDGDLDVFQIRAQIDF